MEPKPLFFVGSSRDDLRALPDDVKDVVGFALYLAQLGERHVRSKPLRGFGGAGVLEVVDHDEGGTYRTVYTVRLAGAGYVLHVFQKKSTRGSLRLVKRSGSCGLDSVRPSSTTTRLAEGQRTDEHVGS
jgi:phage-related protein